MSTEYLDHISEKQISICLFPSPSPSLLFLFPSLLIYSPLSLLSSPLLSSLSYQVHSNAWGTILSEFGDIRSELREEGLQGLIVRRDRAQRWEYLAVSWRNQRERKGEEGGGGGEERERGGRRGEKGVVGVETKGDRDKVYHLNQKVKEIEKEYCIWIDSIEREVENDRKRRMKRGRGR